MRTVFFLAALFFSFVASAQTHRFGRVDILESLKVRKLPGGSGSDSAVVWRGSDGTFRFIPLSTLGFEGGGGGQVYTFSTGLTDTDGTVTNNVSTGVSGGQTITGSTSTNSGMTYKATTGNGTTGADHVFTGGNNGGTEILRLHHDGRIWNTAYTNTLAKVRIGDFTIQPFALNNGFLANNGYHNGTSWTRHVTGYESHFQFFNGQVIFGAANTGTGTFSPANMFKVDYNGNVALGGTSISTTLGTFTGATVTISPTTMQVNGNLMFSGSTSSFPALKRSSTILQVRLADDSDYGDVELKGRAYDASTWNGSNRAVSEDAVRDKVEAITNKPWSVTYTLIANTNDATPTNMTSVTTAMSVPDGTVGILKVHLVGNGSSGAATHKIQGVKYYTFNKSGGTLTIDAADVIIADKKGGSVSSATWQLTSSSNQPVVEVTGISGFITWAATIEIIYT